MPPTTSSAPVTALRARGCHLAGPAGTGRSHEGQGFDPENHAEAEPGQHIGLSVMHERAEKIGAEISIRSQPGSGTEVRLHIPGDFS